MRTECPVASGEDVSGQRLPWRVAGSPKQQHSVWKRDTQAASEADWVWPCKAQSIMLEQFMRTAKHSRCPSSDGLGGQKISAPERSRLIRPQQDATFGKGSVQSVIPLSLERGALRMTTQKYYTPSGKSIQGRGVMPDLLVAVLPDKGEIRKRFREDSLPNFLINTDDTDYDEKYDDIDYPPESWPETRDYQIRKAVDVLKTSRYQTLLAEQDAKFKN